MSDVSDSAQTWAPIQRTTRSRSRRSTRRGRWGAAIAAWIAVVAAVAVLADNVAIAVVGLAVTGVGACLVSDSARDGKRDVGRAPRARSRVSRPLLSGWVRPTYRRSPWAGPMLAAFAVLALLYTWAAPVRNPSAPAVGRPEQQNHLTLVTPPTTRP